MLAVATTMQMELGYLVGGDVIATEKGSELANGGEDAATITTPGAVAVEEENADLVAKLQRLEADKDNLKTMLGKEEEVEEKEQEREREREQEASGGAKNTETPAAAAAATAAGSGASGESPPDAPPAIRASRRAEMFAISLEDARGRCLGATKPWAPFAHDGGGGGRRRRRRGRSLLLEGEEETKTTGRVGGVGDGVGDVDVDDEVEVARWLAEAMVGGVEGGEAGVAGWRDADREKRAEGTADDNEIENDNESASHPLPSRRRQRRRLLAARYRLPPGKYKPLAPKCAAAERVKREVREGEDNLLMCLGKLQKCKEASSEKVFQAATALPGLRAVSAPSKCIIVSNKKGCTSISDNPETVPYIGTKPPAKLKAELPRLHRTCALVGNGPGLKSDGAMGRIIDSHDAVFRFNAFSSLGDWINFTGTKSTYRIFNKKRAETMSNSGNQFRKDSTKSAKEMGEYWIYWNYMSFPYLDAVKRANPNTAIMSPDVLRYMTNAYFKIRQDIHRLGFRGFQCPTNVNSGVHATFMAMQMCERVNLFGFSYSMDMLNKRNDARSPRMSRFHDWAFDTIFLRMLHLGGFINLCTS